jgi:hydroxymethylpyrimidine pyrophosphatase-like HAD family hydrolase
VEETFITHLFPLIEGEAKKRIYLVGEFGATWKEYPRGIGEEIVDKKYSLSEGMVDQLSHLTTKFTESMFWDKAKRVIFTVEVMDNYPLDQFTKDRDNFEKEAKVIVEEVGSDKQILVVPSVIAVDVKDARLNKITGTQVVIKWIEGKGISVDQFIAIGDQPFDADMAKVAFDYGHKAKLVYLGERPLESNLNFPVEITKNKYAKGLLEYLRESNL